MKVTEVRIKKAVNKGNIKAWGSVTLDGMFVIHGVKVIETAEKTFVAMPSRKTADGKFLDVCHPISTEAREIINKAVFAEYEKIKNESK